VSCSLPHVIKIESEVASFSVHCLMTWYVYNSSHNCVGNNIVVALLVLANICRWILISCLNWKLQLFMCFWIFNHLIHHIFLSLVTEYWIQNIHIIVFFGFIHEQSQVDYEESNTLFILRCSKHWSIILRSWR
jgi:hypothetical protein